MQFLSVIMRRNYFPQKRVTPARQEEVKLDAVVVSFFEATHFLHLVASPTKQVHSTQFYFYCYFQYYYNFYYYYCISGKTGSFWILAARLVHGVAKKSWWATRERTVWCKESEGFGLNDMSAWSFNISQIEWAQNLNCWRLHQNKIFTVVHNLLRSNMTTFDCQYPVNPIQSFVNTARWKSLQ